MPQGGASVPNKSPIQEADDDKFWAKSGIPSDEAFWLLCVQYHDNVDKDFSLEVLDDNGNFLSRCPVTIEP